MLSRCLGLVLLAACGLAQACGPLRLAFKAQPGVYERLPDGREQGSDVDAIAELVRRSGCLIETQVLSPAMAWRGLVDGQIDLMSSTLATPEREAHAEIVPVVSGRIVLLVQAAQARRTPTLAALEADPQALVLVQRGAAYPPPVAQWLQSEALRGRVSEAGDLGSALRAFRAGRAAALPMYPLLLTVDSLPQMPEFVVWDAWPQASVPGGLAMSRRSVSEADRARLRQALIGMVRDGTLQRIVERHFDPGLVRQQLRFLDGR
jgi:polar amino acid transport system substrate-binding protein